MGLPGRRPGKRDTRADIVSAARAAVVEEGYQCPSLRSSARRAKVDPALVHHYFEGKPALFAEAMKMGRDPREIAMEMAAGDHDGAHLVQAFLNVWDEGRPWQGGQAPFITSCQAMLSSPQAAAGMREFLQERVWCAMEPRADASGDQAARHALVASQLMGIAWARYVLQLEPVASAPVEAVARWIGPTLDRYMSGQLAAAAPSSEDA
ncbi:MAG: TetR family transcriptional regulator [Actinomycetota bacterium]